MDLSFHSYILWLPDSCGWILFCPRSCCFCRQETRWGPRQHLDYLLLLSVRARPGQVFISLFLVSSDETIRQSSPIYRLEVGEETRGERERGVPGFVIICRHSQLHSRDHWVLVRLILQLNIRDRERARVEPSHWSRSIDILRFDWSLACIPTYHRVFKWTSDLECSILKRDESTGMKLTFLLLVLQLIADLWPSCPPCFLSSQVCLPSYKSVLSPAEINWKINERKTLTKLKYFISSKIIYISIHFAVLFSRQELLYQMHPMITFLNFGL